MYRLKDRLQRFPNTVQFVDPVTGFQSPIGASFSKVVSGVIMMRVANPDKSKQHNLAIDARAVEAEVDSFIAQRCAELGGQWNDFIIETGDGATAAVPPFPVRMSGKEKIARTVAGAKTLIHWIHSGAEAVPGELANSRAATCIACPKNELEDWTFHFTAPVSQAIQEQLRKRKEMHLRTDHDDKLAMCGVCLCPLKLAVHVPIEEKMKRMKQSVVDELPGHCWVRKEAEEKKLTGQT